MIPKLKSPIIQHILLYLKKEEVTYLERNLKNKKVLSNLRIVRNENFYKILKDNQIKLSKIDLKNSQIYIEFPYILVYNLNNISCYNLETGSLTTNMNKFQFIKSILFLKSFQKIIISDSKLIKVLSVQNMNVITTLDDVHTFIPVNIYYFKKKDFIATTGDNEIHFFDIKSGDHLFDLTGHSSNTVVILDLDRLNQDTLLSLSTNYIMRMWNLKNKNCLFVIQASNDFIRFIKYDYLKVTSIVITGGNENICNVWKINVDDNNLIELSQKLSKNDSDEGFYDVFFISKKLVLSIDQGKDKSIRLFNFLNGEQVRIIHLYSQKFVYFENLELIIGYSENELIIYDVRSLLARRISVSLKIEDIGICQTSKKIYYISNTVLKSISI